MSADDFSLQELVARLVEVTGSNAAEAKHLLAACANDVEAAVALHFEQGASGANGESAPIDVDAVAVDIESVNDDEDCIRAPIAPVREQLVLPEDDNFYAAPPPTTSGRLARVTQRVKVCPLRDFAREGALMEAQLQATEGPCDLPSPADIYGASSSSNQRRRIAHPRAILGNFERKALKRKAHLGDLYRPPTDITFAGSFQAARLHATNIKQWLLVNVQDDNFDSQLLNRDVWSEKDVRDTINHQFLLWQVDAESNEGRRFVTFYHCNKLPYVCIIDPRTGEEVWNRKSPKKSNLLNDLQSFLLEHRDFYRVNDDDAPTTSKRPKQKKNDSNAETEKSPTLENQKCAKIMELTEDEQIRLAIKNSMRENGHQNKNQDDENGNGNISDLDSEVEEVEYEDITQSTLCTYDTELGLAKNELTMIKLRLFNANGNDEIIPLRWPSDTKLKVLRHYVAQQHKHIPKQGYKIICAFPRKTLEEEVDDKTLKELGLHPSANLHLTLDD